VQLEVGKALLRHQVGTRFLASQYPILDDPLVLSCGTPSFEILAIEQHDGFSIDRFPLPFQGWCGDGCPVVFFPIRIDHGSGKTRFGESTFKFELPGLRFPLRRNLEAEFLAVEVHLRNRPGASVGVDEPSYQGMKTGVLHLQPGGICYSIHHQGHVPSPFQNRNLFNR